MSLDCVHIIPPSPHTLITIIIESFHNHVNVIYAKRDNSNENIQGLIISSELHEEKGKYVCLSIDQHRVNSKRERERTTHPLGLVRHSHEIDIFL